MIDKVVDDSRGPLCPEYLGYPNTGAREERRPVVASTREQPENLLTPRPSAVGIERPHQRQISILDRVVPWI